MSQRATRKKRQTSRPSSAGLAGWPRSGGYPGSTATTTLSDWAAALTYRGIQSIFPGLLVLVSLLGLLGRSATQPLITQLGAAAPTDVRQIVVPAMQRLQADHATAGILAVVAIIGGLWSASGYIGAFIRASNAVYDVPEGRPFWKIIPLRIAITIVVLVLLVVSR